LANRAYIFFVGIRGHFQAHQQEFIPIPFPRREQHCGGYGGSRGPSAQHITKIFVAATAFIAILADQIMKALGSDVRLFFVDVNLYRYVFENMFIYYKACKLIASAYVFI
jgi:hypothetical protein